jgi:hypothetical protein
MTASLRSLDEFVIRETSWMDEAEVEEKEKDTHDRDHVVEENETRRDHEMQ